MNEDGARPTLRVLIGDGRPVGHPTDSMRDALALAEEQSLLGHDVEIIGSSDRFVSFRTVARIKAKGVDALM